MCSIEFQTIKALESTRHFIVEENSAKQFRCLALELPENMNERKYAEIEKWLAGNAMTLREDRSWPKSVLEYILKNLESRTVFPVDFLFATAFSLDANGISVCSASDMRVHVIKDNQLKFYTRDHVAKFEDPEKVPPIEGQEGFEPFFTLSTRSLGLGSVNPPEEWKWQIAFPFSLFLCSSDIHGNSEIGEFPYNVNMNDLKSSIGADGFAVSWDFFKERAKEQ